MYNFIGGADLDLTATVHSVIAVVVTNGTVTLRNGSVSGTPFLTLTAPATQSVVYAPSRSTLFPKGLYVDTDASSVGTVVQG
jgi:hypothetical protein